MTQPLQPIPVDEQLPHRKTLRECLFPLSTRTKACALVLLAFDFGLLLAALSSTVLLAAWWARLLCGMWGVRERAPVRDRPRRLPPAASRRTVA